MTQSFMCSQFIYIIVNILLFRKKKKKGYLISFARNNKKWNLKNATTDKINRTRAKLIS